MKRRIFALAAFALLVSALAPASALARHRQSECRGIRPALPLTICVLACDALQCDVRNDRRVCDPLRRLFERATRGSSLPCDAAPPPPPPAVCGDGLVNQPGEECDDGNNVSCDFCSFDCKEEFCGDGIVCTGEECEPGDACGDSSCDQFCMCPEPPPPSEPCADTDAPTCGGFCTQGQSCIVSGGTCACVTVGE